MRRFDNLNPNKLMPAGIMTPDILFCQPQYKVEMSGARKSTTDESPEGNIAVEEDVTTQKPKQYAVILLNDDYTPMEFVILILKRFFGKTQEAAEAIMLDVHKKGQGVAGIYSYEVAEMKVMQVNQFSQLNQYPLKSSLEPIEEA